MSSFKKIESLEHLKELSAKGPIETFILLNFGLRSSKNISYNSENDTWYIYNYIDDTEQTLRTEELTSETNIIEALEKKALYQY